MKSYNCSLCHHFKTNTILNPDSGECHRRSPKGRDSNGMALATSRREFFQAENISATLYSEVPTFLYKCQFETGDTSAPLPICKDITVGLNSDEIEPFMSGGGTEAIVARITASRTNTGAATVGVTPILRIKVIRVLSATSVDYGTIEIPISASKVGIFNSPTDLFPSFSIVVDPGVAIPNATWGFYIDLDTTNSPDFIAQIKNPNVVIETVIPRTTSNPFALIENRNTFWCSQFKPQASRIETCWTCQHFEPLNVGVDNSGSCRRNPPGKFDQETIWTASPPNTLPTNWNLVFPFIADGNDNFCGDFKPSTTTVPDPV